jgi:hypothetical protein
MLIKKNIV